MKKILISAVVALTAMGLSAQADYSIQWQNTGTGLTLDGTAGNPIAPTIGRTALMELVFAGADGMIDPVLYDDGSTQNAAGAPGDDIVLATFVHQNLNDSTGGKFGFFQANYGGAGTPFLGAGVYMRATAGTRADGAQYATTALLTATDKIFGGPAPTPDVLSWPAGLVTLSQTVVAIPEPTSIAMLALGVLTAFVRHRRRS